MLQLKGITKDYPVGGTAVHALKGIDVTFRDREFVSVLGQSGCGKTTLLNIIGGLDHYTTGDLVINGRSTRSYRDRDWDTYRNHSVGFVFQAYNLIGHQSVLSNVEMALLLSGAPAAERRRRAEAALRRVGLGEHLKKRPNQLSGGQMQRVAIARAIVNDPEIILADEPTGALDTKTSVEVMEILKELSRDRLVVMVTHNPQLAEKYSDRIVRVSDGRITSDSDPCEGAEARLDPDAVQAHAVADAKKGRRGMSFAAAVNLSFNNLMTKKGRTLLTVFAGSIGIIGIALILSLSTGAQDYIDTIEQDTLSSYPLTIQRDAMDMSSLMEAMTGGTDKGQTSLPDALRTRGVMNDTITKVVGGSTRNDLKSLRAHIEGGQEGGSSIRTNANDVQYRYDAIPYFYKSDTSEGAVQLNPSKVFSGLGLATETGTSEASDMRSQIGQSMNPSASNDSFQQLMDNPGLLASQYDVLAGRMPKAWDEVVIVADKSGTVSDYLLYNLGLLDSSKLQGMMNDALSGNRVEGEKLRDLPFSDYLKLTFKLVPQTARYQKDGDVWRDRSSDDAFMRGVVDGAETVRVVGIIKPNQNAQVSEGNGSVGYTAALTGHLLDEVNGSAIVRDQKARPDTDVFSGVAFDASRGSDAMTLDQIEQYVARMPEATRTQVQGQIDAGRKRGMSDQAIAQMFQKQMSDTTNDATYDSNMRKLGASSADDPEEILIYPKDFNAKEAITSEIDTYNERAKADGEDSKEIRYTDYVGLLMGSVRTIVNSISYALVAFVAISLVVSSIMIGIITYISVLERTKEIGILRAIGASKRDVSRVFTAETLIIGASSGVLAIAVSAAALLPINQVIYQVAQVQNMARLPIAAGAALIGISMLLTLAAGLGPSRMAAKKDPVAALRSE